MALLPQRTSHDVHDDQLAPSPGLKPGLKRGIDAEIDAPGKCEGMLGSGAILESRSVAFFLLGLGTIVMILGTTVVIYEQF